MRNLANRSKQKGAALFLSLVVMLLMTGIILHGARSSLLDAKIANNGQHAVRALMVAEDSALAGELLIELNYPGAPDVDLSANAGDGIYLDGEVNVNSVDWQTYASESTGVGANARNYIVEYIGPMTTTSGSLSVGAGVSSDKRYVYRISGRGASTQGAARVVQTIYATLE
jgi:type IV pilus assembly protein PilX